MHVFISFTREGAVDKEGRADYTVVVHEDGPVDLAAAVSHDPGSSSKNSNSWSIWFDNDDPNKWSVPNLTETMQQHSLPEFFLDAGVHTLHVGALEQRTRMQLLTITGGQASFIGEHDSLG